MSGTSEYQGRVRLDSAVWGVSNRAVGTISSRGVANNINHFSDSYGQRRMQWNARTPAVAGVPEYVARDAANTWSMLAATGPFPIALREDGSSYRIRVEVAAAMESVATGYVAVVLAPIDVAWTTLYLAQSATGSAGPNPTDAVWVSSSFTSTTPDYRTGASKGPRAWTRSIALTADEASRYVVPVSGLVDIGGAAGAGPQCVVALSVWGTTATAGVEVRLHAAALTEWVGT